MTTHASSNIFAVYKPTGVTSHDVVNMVRRKTGVKRVGHGGTLDPLAEGVLVIAVGRENTKLLDKYVKGDKEYIATLMLGYTSVTDDREGPIKECNLEIKPKLEDIELIIKKFVGEIMQTPPIYSAIHINGKKAYKIARAARSQQGLSLEEKMKPRMIRINTIEIVSYEYPTLELKIECGTGVYIRSLAKNMGEELKTGAYLLKLVRTRVGEFTADQSVQINDL